VYEQRASESALANCMWRARATRDGNFTDPASERWSLNFVRQQNGIMTVEIYGPSTSPRVLNWRKGETYWGIDFNAYVLMPGFNKEQITGVHLTLPVTDGEFEIGVHRIKVADYEHLEQLVDGMQTAGVLTESSLVHRVLAGKTSGTSERNRQRQVRRVTGLSQKQILQVRRARYAEELLRDGYLPAEVAQLAGYADQPHMTRAIKQTMGKTPGQIVRE